MEAFLRRLLCRRVLGEGLFFSNLIEGRRRIDELLRDAGQLGAERGEGDVDAGPDERMELVFNLMGKRKGRQGSAGSATK
jgi:hypothetical protein